MNSEGYFSRLGRPICSRALHPCGLAAIPAKPVPAYGKRGGRESVSLSNRLGRVNTMRFPACIQDAATERQQLRPYLPVSKVLSMKLCAN